MAAKAENKHNLRGTRLPIPSSHHIRPLVSTSLLLYASRLKLCKRSKVHNIESRRNRLTNSARLR